MVDRELIAHLRRSRINSFGQLSARIREHYKIDEDQLAKMLCLPSSYRDKFTIDLIEREVELQTPREVAAYAVRFGLPLDFIVALDGLDFIRHMGKEKEARAVHAQEVARRQEMVTYS